MGDKANLYFFPTTNQLEIVFSLFIAYFSFLTAPSAAKPIRKSSTTPNFLNKTAPAFTSNALQKAAQLGAKFAKKKAAIAKRQDSDSDDELKLQASVSSKFTQGKREDEESSEWGRWKSIS